tara:strand:+ start:294 stop:1073 length:780 start_codon:yes stop_codon:yes gene_type:complete
MSANIQFIEPVSGSSITPSFGLLNEPFSIQGQNLNYVTGVKFVDAYDNPTDIPFSIESSTKINGTVPLLDGTIGKYEIRLQNELGDHDFGFFNPIVPALAAEPRRLIQIKVNKITDHLAINAPIQENSPNQTQGYEIAATTITPIHGASTLLINCELLLENDFWGGAVVALFKDGEAAPRKIWNYGMTGLNMGTTASLTYVTTAVSSTAQTWRLRLGRTHTSFSTIYLNRNINNNNPYGLDIAHSSVIIKEIEAQGVSY